LIFFSVGNHVFRTKNIPLKFVDAKLAKHLCKQVAQIIDGRSLSCQTFKQTADSFFQHLVLDAFMHELLVSFKFVRRQLCVCKFNEHAQEIIFV
jgi:hypothetical protein